MGQQENKERFIDILTDAAKRRCGFIDFMEWLSDTDFFTAPASTKYHGAVEGGLLQHSLNVYDRLKSRAEEYAARGGYRESIAITALLHDVCKVGRYKPKDGGGYTYESDIPLPVGHGERSVILIQQHMTLTFGEITAIRWHMGAFDDAFRGGANREMSAAFRRCPLAVMLHLADMEASYLDENKGV